MTTWTKSEHLPEAGKPEGRCEECGGHGNRGRVTLVYSVVPCYTCQNRADRAAYARAQAMAGEMKAEVEAKGFEVDLITGTFSGGWNGSGDPNRATWERKAIATIKYGPKKAALTADKAADIKDQWVKFAQYGMQGRTPVGVP